MARCDPLWAALAVAALAIACSGDPSGDAPSGTLAGQVTAGPFCPVEVEGEACPPPPGVYEAMRVLVYARPAGIERLVAETRPDAAGRFRLRLPGGSYTVSLESSIGLPGTPPPTRQVRVAPDSTTTVSFDVDTGIR